MKNLEALPLSSWKYFKCKRNMFMSKPRDNLMHRLADLRDRRKAFLDKAAPTVITMYNVFIYTRKEPDTPTNF